MRIDATTLYIIPNTLVPYGYEVVPLLGLPTGVESRFRFREEWLSEQVKLGYDKFAEKPLLVVLRDYATGKLIPLRSGTVEKIDKIGETFFISFRLGPLVEYDSDESLRERQLSSYNVEFHKEHGEQFKSLPSEPMRPLVFGTNFKYSFDNSRFAAHDYFEVDLERFDNIISCIKDIEFFKGVQFLKVIDIRRIKDQRAALVTDRHFLLAEDNEYLLRIYQTAPTLSSSDLQSANDVSISSDEKYINIIRGKNRAVGKYDVMAFNFRTTYNSSSARTFLEVLYKVKQSDDRFIEPSINLPIRVDLTISKILKNIFFIVLFVGVYLYVQVLRSVNNVAIEALKDLFVVGFAAAVIDLKSKLLEISKRS